MALESRIPHIGDIGDSEPEPEPDDDPFDSRYDEWAEKKREEERL